MNERIKELAEQAGFYVSANGAEILIPDPHTEDITGVMEKFAELLIQECVEVCNKIYFDRYPEADGWERSEEGDAIKKRFGVAE